MKDYIAEEGSVLPILSTILFFTIFVLVLFYLLTDRRKKHHQTMSALPLDDSPAQQKQEDRSHG